jgi:hypothetical protein
MKRAVQVSQPDIPDTEDADFRCRPGGRSAARCPSMPVGWIKGPAMKDDAAISPKQLLIQPAGPKF